jgi:hypothetical protein
VLAGWDVISYRSQGLEELRVRGARLQTLLLGQIGELQARWSDQLGSVLLSSAHASPSSLRYRNSPAQRSLAQAASPFAASSCRKAVGMLVVVGTVALLFELCYQATAAPGPPSAACAT